MRERYSNPARRFSKLALAAATCLGSVKRSTAVKTSDFAATTMPLRPMLMPAQAADCQLCAGTPGTNVAATISAIGTVQLTSPPIREEEVNALGGDSFKSGGTANLTEIGRGVTKVIDRLKEMGRSEEHTSELQ